VPTPTEIRVVRHDLSRFRGAGYDRGRPVAWQALWFATQHLLFASWWFPMRLRPALLRAFGAQVGAGVRIRPDVRVHWPWKLIVGDHTWIGEGAWLLNLEPITIGAHVCVSQESFVCTGSHQHHSESFEFDNAPIVIDDGCWLAAQSLVLRGVTIGAGALVGARAIAAHDVPPGYRIPAGSHH
jgi:putative colanic acid biosynthesis acetyltransferase WcaF